MVTIGFLEGVAEATAATTKIFSGALSDFLGKRKFLVVLGYGLGAITKPVFPLAPSISWVFAARFTDRIGKGIRGAPRDALVADITAPELRGPHLGFWLIVPRRWLVDPRVCTPQDLTVGSGNFFRRLQVAEDGKDPQVVNNL
jgi:MFS family permease